MSKVFDYEIKFNSEKLEQNIMNDFGIGGIVQKRWDDIAKNGMRKYVPHDQGILEDSSSRPDAPELGSGVISYKTPYARRLYYNPQYNFLQDSGERTSSGTRGGNWAERAARDNIASWEAALQDFIDGKG